MATYDSVVKAARMTATKGEVLDGTLELTDAGGTNVLVIYTFSASAGSVTTDTWTLGFVDTAGVGTTAAGAGTDAALARLKDSLGNIRLSGLTVGTSGTNVIVDNVNIAEGQTVNITGTPTVTHAA